MGVDDEGLPSGREEAELLSLRATFCVRDIWAGHWELQGQKTIYDQSCPVEESLANESGRTATGNRGWSEMTRGRDLAVFERVLPHKEGVMYWARGRPDACL